MYFARKAISKNIEKVKKIYFRGSERIMRRNAVKKEEPL